MTVEEVSDEVVVVVLGEEDKEEGDVDNKLFVSRSEVRGVSFVIGVFGKGVKGVIRFEVVLNIKDL